MIVDNTMVVLNYKILQHDVVFFKAETLFKVLLRGCTLKLKPNL